MKQETELPLLQTQGLCAWYGAAQVLFDVGLNVQQGEVVALMGRNGAGKSTTLKTIMGLLDKRQGHVQFAGQEISRIPAYRIARMGLGFVPEDRRIFTELTVMQNLEVGRQAARCRPGEETPMPEWTPEKVVCIVSQLKEMRDGWLPYEWRRQQMLQWRAH